MKRFAYTLFCMAAFATSALAQANSDTLRVVESNVSRVGEDVIVDMKLDLSDIEVGRNRRVDSDYRKRPGAPYPVSAFGTRGGFSE